MAKKNNDLSSSQDYIYSRLVDDYEIPQKQAIAIVANLTHESGLNTGALGDSGDSYGIQQWKGSRRKALEKFSSGRGHDTPDLDDQIDFLVDEYKNGKAFLFQSKGKNLYKEKKGKGITSASDYYQFSKSEFENAGSLFDAVIAWNQGAGRPHKKWAMNDRRYNIAENLAKRYGIEDEETPMYTMSGYIDSESTNVITSDSDSIDEVSKPLNKPVSSEFEAGDDITPQSDFMTKYGINIVSQAIASSEDNSIVHDPDEIRYEAEIQAKESEYDRRAELLKKFLPGIQLSIKGVSD